MLSDSDLFKPQSKEVNVLGGSILVKLFNVSEIKQLMTDAVFSDELDDVAQLDAVTDSLVSTVVLGVLNVDGSQRWTEDDRPQLKNLPFMNLKALVRAINEANGLMASDEKN